MHQYATGSSLEKCDLCNERKLDRFGDHAANCKQGFGMHFRHRGIQSTVYDLFKSNNILVQKEVAAPESTDGLVPGDIYLPIGVDAQSQKLGAPSYIDITIVNPTSDSCVNEGANQPNYYLDAKVEKKLDKYKETFKGNGYKGSSFSVFALDIYGTMHSRAQELTLNLAKIGAQFHQVPLQKCLNHCLTKIQFCLAKCVAAQIQTRTPRLFNNSSLHDDSSEFCSNPVTSGW